MFAPISRKFGFGASAFAMVRDYICLLMTAIGIAKFFKNLG